MIILYNLNKPTCSLFAMMNKFLQLTLTHNFQAPRHTLTLKPILASLINHSTMHRNFSDVQHSASHSNFIDPSVISPPGGSGPKKPRAPREKKVALMITDQAASRIKELMSDKPDSGNIFGVKIDVRRRGCNGYSYVMDYVTPEQVTKLDEVVEERGVRVVIDKKALMFVVGTEMDFVDNEIKSEFVFNNPNAKGTCGCGESFHV